MARERIEWRSLILLCSVSLFAQAPPPESFHLGELTKVVSHDDGKIQQTRSPGT